MGAGVEAPDTSLVRRGNGNRRGKGGVETPDTSLVRRNQIKQRGEKGELLQKRGEVWRPLTRLWSEETK